MEINEIDKNLILKEFRKIKKLREIPEYSHLAKLYLEGMKFVLDLLKIDYKEE